MSGSISYGIAGGTPPYYIYVTDTTTSAVLAASSTTFNYNGLSVSSYLAYVVDSSNPQAISNTLYTIISQPSQINMVSGNTVPAIGTSTTGSTKITTTGGNIGPYTYFISPSAGSVSPTSATGAGTTSAVIFSGLSSSSIGYEITVTDISGCTESIIVVIPT